MFQLFNKFRLPSICCQVAWGSTASFLLALIVGCGEAPTPPSSTASTSPAETSSAEDLEAFPTLAEPISAAAIEAEAEPTPVAAIATEVVPTPVPGDMSWATTPSPLEEPQPTLAPETQVAEAAPVRAMPTEPTPAMTAIQVDPTPIEAVPTAIIETPAARLTPGGLSASISPPPPAEPAHQPKVVAQAGQPVTNANVKPLDAKPLDMAKPRSLIHISPRSLAPTPSLTAPLPEPTNSQTSSPIPAVILPPSPVADAAALAPLSPLSPVPSVPRPTVTEAGPALASIEQPLHQPMPPEMSSTAEQPQSGIPVAPVSISSSDESPPASSTPPEGFTPLFNDHDLTGWEVFDGKTESWQSKDGTVSCVAPGGGWLQTLAMYSDFELQFEYRLSEGGNSGVALRFPGHGNPSLQGLEIQLLDDRAEKYQTIQPQQATGSLYFVAAPKVRDIARAAGEWNACRLRCSGHQLQVSINGLVVNEIDLSQLSAKSSGISQPVSGVRCPMGTIALQSHSTRVDFRHVNVRDLTQPLASGVRWLDLKKELERQSRSDLKSPFTTSGT